MRYFYQLWVQWNNLLNRLFTKKNPSTKQRFISQNALLDEIALSLDHERDYLWFHCNDTDELHKAIPLMDKIRGQNPEQHIVVTYRQGNAPCLTKTLDRIDCCFALPLDTAAFANRFLEYVNPTMAVFVKTKGLYNYIAKLHESKTPSIVISGMYQKKDLFFTLYGTWFAKQLKKVTYFFVQDKKSQELLYSIGVNNVMLSGDGRFDRVINIAQNPGTFSNIEKFIQGSIVVAGGNLYPKEAHELIPLVNKNHSGIKYILALNSTDKASIVKITEKIETPCVLYSEFHEQSFMEAKVLIIDEVGILPDIYQYASVALLGGGFDKDLQCVLEPAVYGMPLLLGPDYKKDSDAMELMKQGGAFMVKNHQECTLVIEKILGNYEVLKLSSAVSREYVKRKRGATEKILSFVNTIISPRVYKPEDIKSIQMN